MIIVSPPRSPLLAQCIPRPLIRSQKDSSANTNPRNPGRKALKQSPPPLLSPYPRQYPPRPLPLHTLPFMAPPIQHQIRLQHIQRRRRTRRHRPGHTSKDRTLRCCDETFFPVALNMLPLRVCRLQILPKTELHDREWDLAHYCDAATAVEFSEYDPVAAVGMCRTVAQGEDVFQRGEGGAVEETGLGALLDYFGGDADGAGGNFAQG